MCIICIKKPGLDLPTDSILENMWYANSDGAGIMYTNRGKKVTIKKGFMTFGEFMDGIRDLKNTIDVKNEAVVLHFRIGTSGGNVAGNTHPFPITEKVEDLKSLSITTNLGIAHNGIISITPSRKDISDTMEYIKSRLMPIYRAKKYFFKYDDIMKLIEKEITSKMVFLSPNKSIYTIGNFITDNTGLMYSNGSYLRTPYRYFKNNSSIIPYNYTYGGYFGADDDDDVEDYNASFNTSYSGYSSYTGIPDYSHGMYSMDSDWLSYREKLTVVDGDCYIVDRFTGDAYGVDDLCGYDYLCGIDKFGEVYLIDPVRFDNVVAYALFSGFAAYYPNGQKVFYDNKTASDVLVDGASVVDPESIISNRGV